MKGFSMPWSGALGGMKGMGLGVEGVLRLLVNQPDNPCLTSQVSTGLHTSGRGRKDDARLTQSCTPGPSHADVGPRVLVEGGRDAEGHGGRACRRAGRGLEGRGQQSIQAWGSGCIRTGKARANRYGARRHKCQSAPAHNERDLAHLSPQVQEEPGGAHPRPHPGA